jgi:hypothetical protein
MADREETILLNNQLLILNFLHRTHAADERFPFTNTFKPARSGYRNRRHVFATQFSLFSFKAMPQGVVSTLGPNVPKCERLSLFSVSFRNSVVVGWRRWFSTWPSWIEVF